MSRARFLPAAWLLILGCLLAGPVRAEGRVVPLSPSPEDALIGKTRFAFEVPDAQPPVDRIDVYLGGRLIGAATAPDWSLVHDVRPGPRTFRVLAVAYAGEQVVEQLVITTRRLGLIEREDVSVVQLFPVVTDRRGRYVRELGLADFEVLDQGRPIEVEHFSSEAVASRLSLLLDVSKSMEDKIMVVREACRRFLDRVQDRHGLSLYAFNHALIRVLERPEGFAQVQAAVSRLRTGGGTALYDALIEVMREARGIKGRRAVFVFSDGQDERSLSSLEAVIREARESGVLVYAVGTLGGRRAARSRDDLLRLARETGGQAYFVRRVSDLGRVFARISEDLEGQYVLSYPTPPGPPGLRPVEVRVRDSRYSVRCRTHYFVEPAQRRPSGVR